MSELDRPFKISIPAKLKIWSYRGWSWACREAGDGLLPHAGRGNYLAWESAFKDARLHYLKSHAMLTPERWLMVIGDVLILDNDGWTHGEWRAQKPILAKEFFDRLNYCTVSRPCIPQSVPSISDILQDTEGIH